MKTPPTDRNGRIVKVGSKVRLLRLSGDWFDNLPLDEVPYILSMIGEIFTVEEIDDYGSPWVRKAWFNEEEGTCIDHSIALASDEMELVDANKLDTHDYNGSSEAT